MARGDDRSKADLRSDCLAARARLPPDTRSLATRVICGRLLELPEITRARAVLGYAAFGTEVDLDGVLASLLQRGAGVFLPWVADEGLRIARVRDLDADLAPGWRGVREPRAARRRAARPERLEAALVPGVAFDRRGHRLGYGGGHFDRLLARIPATLPRIGVAFSIQVIDKLPFEAHDVPMHIVVTDQETLRPQHGGLPTGARAPYFP